MKNKGMNRNCEKSQHKSLRGLNGKDKVKAKAISLYAHSTPKSGRKETKNQGTGPR